MKKLYTLHNTKINKSYDLAIFTYGELKETILNSSGLTLRQMQLNFNKSAVPDFEYKEYSEEELDRLEQ